MKSVRIDHVTVVSPDGTAAAATFQRLFGLAATSGRGGPALAIGDARIEFVTPRPGTPLAAALEASGEGMASLTLAVADLDDAGRTLERAAVPFERGAVDGLSAITVDPRAAHGVRLTLVAAA
jgi:catechol 2,3-dioxygenase-like lactoylglutathione lyase family enzyme